MTWRRHNSVPEERVICTMGGSYPPPAAKKCIYRERNMLDYPDYDAVDFNYAEAMRPYYLGEEVQK